MRALAILGAAALLGACTPEAPPPKQTPPAAVAAAEVTTDLSAGARVRSPLTVKGVAPGTWYFEAVFVARLEDAEGKLLSEGPAQAQGEWMTEGPVPFSATLPFTVTAETPATLVLQEDMPSGEGTPRELRIPIVLTP